MEDKSMDIFFQDLVPETQKEVLKFMGLDTPEDGNYNVFPLTSITVGDIEEFNDVVKSRRNKNV